MGPKGNNEMGLLDVLAHVGRLLNTSNREPFDTSPRQRKYRATIRLRNSYTQHVFVEAETMLNAKSMIESQYGKGCIMVGPSEVR